MDILTPRKMTLIILGGVLLLFIYLGFLSISRHGKSKIEITVAPEDSVIRIDGKVKNPGTLYLSPGIYTITASKKDFKTDWQKITVKTGEDNIVRMLPEPDSQKAYDYLQAHPQIQAAREAIGGQKANQEGEEVRKKYPITDYLPITWNHGLSSIGTGSSSSIPGGTAIIVTGETAADRKAAIDWIRQQGFNPSDMDIEFIDFNNLFTRDLPGQGE